MTELSISHEQETLQTASKQDMMPESQTCDQTEHSLLTAKLNYSRVDAVGNSCAKSIMSRDYKGFGTSVETQNGVIERNE